MPRRRAKAFFDRYAHDLTPRDFQRIFTRDTPEAYRYFARTIDTDKLALLPWHRRWPIHVRLVFIAFVMRLSPGRRVLYAFALAALCFGMLELFRDIGPVRILIFPLSGHLVMPRWADGTLWLFLAFVVVNLLLLMEVADRLSLKSDLEIARDIQLAMLPAGTTGAGDAVVFGMTRPANTVGGDFYDVLQLPDGRLAIAVGDVAGKGSPAALLMALLLAMLRTLVDEGLEASRLATRLNAQVARHSPTSRFITLFYGVYDPRDGTIEYINAGHLPPMIRRADQRIERVDPTAGGIALGLFEGSTYSTHRVALAPGDAIVLYSDGITEAENARGEPFDEAGLARVLSAHAASDPEATARAILDAVDRHAGEVRLHDDLTALVLRRS
jgi:serine phosphatase RsbU (regulator of sigma subunit)